LVNTIDLKNGSKAGLFAFGDWNNAIGIVLGDGKAEVIKRHRSNQEALASVSVPESDKAYLRMTTSDGHKLKFSVWAADKWIDVGDDLVVSGDYLPPWDRGLRVTLTAGGSENATARFDWLRVINQQTVTE